MNHPSTIKSPLPFFALVFALSIPFWLAGALTGRQLLPGLPVSSLSAFIPLAAALILVYRENKAPGVAALLKRSFDYHRIQNKAWYAPIFLLVPAVMLLSYALMRWLGSPVPFPQFPPVWMLLAMFLAFFISALGEELGWSGYVTDRLQARWSALQAGLLLGGVWAAWHFVTLLEAHRSPYYIAWQSFAIVVERVLFVWLYNNTGKSVFAAAVFHALFNLTWQLFPVSGSFYDPRITGLIVAFAASLVVLLWGPKTLANFVLKKV